MNTWIWPLNWWGELKRLRAENAMLKAALIDSEQKRLEEQITCATQIQASTQMVISAYAQMQAQLQAHQRESHYE